MGLEGCYHKSPIHPKESMTFRIIFQEFYGMSKYPMSAYIEVKSGTVSVSFDEGNAVNKDL
jgi:hypothetical protein